MKLNNHLVPIRTKSASGGPIVPALLMLVIIIIIVLAGIFFSPYLINLLNNPDQLRRVILNTGIWAPLSMIGFQVVQVIIAPLPGQIVALLSGYVFGVFSGTVLSMIGVIIGAVAAFLLARISGRRLLKSLLSESKFEKFDSYSLKQGPFLLFLFLLIPNPLGDVVYYLAGLTNIPIVFYVILVFVGRLPSNIVNNLIGAKVTSFNKYHWIIFSIIIIILALLYYLNRNHLERIIVRLSKVKRPVAKDQL